MSDGFSIDVLGNRTILDNLDQFSTDVQDGIQADLEDAATYGLQLAEDRAAVRTGFMRSRLYVEVQPGQAIIGDDAEYSLFVELGTYKMAAQPFLVPSWIDAGAWLQEKLAGLLGK